MQCTSLRDRTWSERPCDDRRVRLRPDQRSHTTRPPPKSARPALHRSVESAEGSTPRAPCAGQPRFRACAQLSDGCSAGERHDFPYSEVKRRGTPTRFGARGQSVRLVDGPHEHRQPDTFAGNIGAEHQRGPAAIHASPAATCLDPDVIRWNGGIAQSLRPEVRTREQAGYASRKEPHSDSCSLGRLTAPNPPVRPGHA